MYVPAPIIAQNEAFDQSLFWQTLTNRRMVWQDGWAVRPFYKEGHKYNMKTHWPFGGFFLKPSDEKNGTHEYEDYLKECEEEKQLPEEELEFHCSKDPKKMTMQESQEEIGKFLCWNKMTPEERRAELEAQKAATCDTEQAAGDMPCAIEPESAPDTPQGAVLDEAVDAPPGVDSVPGDVSGDAPESAADTVLDNVPDAAEGYVPDAIGALKAPEKEAVNATAQGVIAPETTTAETLMQQGAEPTRQAAEPEAEAEGISSPQTPEPIELQEGCCAVQEAEEAPEVEVVPAEAIVPLVKIGGDAPAEKERWAYASELIGDAFQHWGNGRVLLDMGTGRGKSEFVIRKMAGWAVDRFLKGNYDNRILMICPLTLLHEDLEKRRRAEYLMVFGDDSEEGWDLYKEVLTVITYQKLEQLCKGDASDQRILQELLDRHRIIIADECHYWSEFSAFNINTHYSLDALLQAEKDHTVVYMSTTGRDTWKLLEEKGGPTQSERIYRLPQYYEYVKAAYFYARHNLVTILRRLPAGEKAIVFMELGDDLVEMEKIFGDTAAYYCSPFNERYRKKYSDFSVCVKDGQQLKDILFTTKAMGVGIGLKDRGVKHIFIDQWNPLEIAQSLGRKRSLDADDTCTVYFRDYSLDWYWGTNSGLKRFRGMLLNKYLPAQAYMADEEEFNKYLHSDNPEVIQKKIDKSKILEHNVVTGYHINPLGLQQVKHDLETLYDIMSSTNYPESFMKYAMFNLHQPIKAYRFKDLEDWLYAHLNQPMDSEEMTEKIMSFGYIEKYQGREPGQMGLNKFLLCYGVKIISDRENKRNENRNKTFWILIKQ